MTTTVTGEFTDFYEKTTKNFNVTISLNGESPDISSDTVTLVLKTIKNGSVPLTKDADVTTYGATGIARFELDPTDTTIAPGEYYFEITWTPASGGLYVLDHGKVKVLDSLV